MNKLINIGAWVVFGYALIVSVSHIIHTGLMIGLPTHEAYTAWIVVDIMFLLGKAGRSSKRAGIRKAGLWLMLFGGSLSLTANIAAGPTVGAKIWGVVVVAAMLAAETYAARLTAERAGEAEPADKVIPQADADAAVAAAVAIVQAEAATLMAEIEHATRAAVVAELTARFDAEREATATAAAEVAAARAQQRRNGNAARALAATSPNMKPAQLAKATGVSASTAAKILADVTATAPVSPGRVPVTELNADMAAA